MCTAVHFKNFFGRNLDLDFSYNQQILITPRRFPLTFRTLKTSTEHFAVIGAGIVNNDYPLYFDAMNEKGLCAAGLNFPENAHYMPICHDADNLAPFELIPYILARCSSVADAKKLLTRVNIADIHFSKEFPNTPLHWAVADKNHFIVVESVKNALKIYENPVGVLTNSPGFDYHLTNLTNYMNITAKEPQNRFSDKISLSSYSRGMGAVGLPGDLSSSSRFVRAAFTLLNSHECNLSQFFHILQSVQQTKGSACAGNNFEYTIYSSCCDMEKLIYYYTTYENSRIAAVDIKKTDMDSQELTLLPMLHNTDILLQN